jgi:hypothetical protein
MIGKCFLICVEIYSKRNEYVNRNLEISVQQKQAVVLTSLEFLSCTETHFVDLHSTRKFA